MKKLLLLIFAATTMAGAIAQEKVLFDELSSVNKEWLKQQICDPHYHFISENLSENEKIQLHLKEVEKILRSRDVSHLTAEQQLARKQNLDFLNEYWKRGKFPKNYYHNYRIPYFIDPEGTACAVGYLIIRSGHEELAASIATQTNYAYLAEMEYKALDNWAGASGLSFDELAWIQPAYPPPAYNYAMMGAGTNGSVNEILPAPAGDVVYVGGEFSEVNGNLTVNNIAEWRNGIAGFSWLNMNGGVNGPVYAMILFNGDLYVGGHFTIAGNKNVTNIARWDGIEWHAVGYLPDVVYDLEIHNNELIAGGAFAAPASLGIARVARWDGSVWNYVGNNFINDTVFDVLSAKGDLYVAGAFTGTEMGSVLHVAKLENGLWSSMGNDISTVARALTIHNDTIYVGGDIQSSVSVEKGLWKWDGQNWINIPLYVSSFDNKPYINKMVSHGNSLVIAGKFDYFPLVGTALRNVAKVPEVGNHLISIGNFDSTVNTVASQSSYLYIGGLFDQINGAGDFNHIVYTDFTLGVEPVQGEGKLVQVHPNPFRDLATIKVSHIKKGQELRIFDIAGKEVMKINELKQDNVISGAGMATGTYFYQLYENGRILEKGKMVIQ